MGMSLPNGFWVASDTSVRQSAGPGSGGHPHSMSEAPWVQEARFLWHRLGLAPADLDRNVARTTMGRSPHGIGTGTGAPPLSMGISTDVQDQSRNAAVPPCSRSPGLAQAASSNPQYRAVAIGRGTTGGSPAGTWRRKWRSSVGIPATSGLSRTRNSPGRAVCEPTAYGDGYRRVHRSPQQGFNPQVPSSFENRCPSQTPSAQILRWA